MPTALPSSCPQHRVAVVTGGAAGIGAAVARSLAEAFAEVHVLDVQPCDGGIIVDVADEARCIEAVHRIGHVDILVNCAGGVGPTGPLWRLPSGVAERVIAVNLLGTYYMCRAVLPSMLKAGWGRIVNMSSVAGKEGNAASGPYSAAKGGVIALTKTLAREVADRGILVNCVTPTVIDTPLIRALPPTRIRRLVARVPMGRMGQPEEVAALVGWLCSEECSFSTGAVFDISGGRASY